MASAGDQDGDGRADVLVGAPTADTNGPDAGAAYVFSGRTYERLRRIDGPDVGDNFGSATDWTASLDGDATADLLAGAYLEGPGPAPGGGGAHAFSGATGAELLPFAKPPGAAVFGNFFVAGLGRVDGDAVPDVYAADYNAQGGNGYAAVYSGADGSIVHEWPGGPGEGTGPGREALDVDRDGRTDIAVGPTPRATGRPAPDGSTSTPGARAGSCAASRRRRRARTWASTRSASRTSTATAGRTCCCRPPRATPSTSWRASPGAAAARADDPDPPSTALARAAAPRGLIIPFG